MVEFLCENKKDFKVIGHTSNLYFKNTYRTDAIISTRKMTAYIEKDGKLICDAGVNISQLSKHCVEQGIVGFEGLVGLPGTVAAAVVNNSSCFKCSIFDLLIDVDVILIERDGTCSFRTIKWDELGFAHRSSAIGEIWCVLVNTFPCRKFLNYSLSEQLRDILPNLATASVMALIVYSVNFLDLTPALSLIIQITLGEILYILISSLSKNESYQYCKGEMKRFLERLRK